MIEIINSENSPIVEISINGSLTKEDIQKIEAFFESQVSDEQPVNVLLQMENWDGITFKGLVEDFKLIKQIKKIEKAAVVADSTFLKADAKVENLFPGIEVKYFELNETTSAKRWLTQSEEGKTFYM